jgi:L-lactate dehydrogenase complex protein LldG
VTGERDRIIEAIRAELGSNPQDPQAIAAEAKALLEAPELIRPRLLNVGLVEVFAQRVVSPKVGATLERVGILGELPDAVRRYLMAQGLPISISIQPAAELLGLDWSGIAIDVGLARWGITETGSLVFHSGPDTPVLFNFLPLHHVVAVKAEAIVAHLEDYAAIMASTGPPPRNVNLITGASGTTDIEGSFVRGAHGPRYLHVVLVERDR